MTTEAIDTRASAQDDSKGHDLAPDVDDAKKPLTKTFNDVQLISSYCHGLINTHVKPVKGADNDWYDKFEPLFEKAQGHARTWINELQPDISSKVPQTLINYNDTFVAAMGRVEDMLQPLGDDPLSDSQQKQLHELLKAVRTRLGQQRSTIEDIYDDLVTFSNNLIDDHKALFDGVDNIQSEIIADQQDMDKINAKINAVNSKIQADSQIAMSSEIGLGVAIFITVAGIGLAVATEGAALPLVAVGLGVLGVGGAIAGTVIFSKKVNEDLDELHDLQNKYSDEQRQVTALSGISAAVDGLKNQNEAAQKALSGVLTVWKTLEEKLDGVIEDIDNSEDDAKASALLALLDIDTAKIKWKQLYDFADGMQTAFEKTKVVVLPPNKKAGAKQKRSADDELDALLAQVAEA